MVLQVAAYLAYLGCCRERSTSPIRGDVSTNALAGYTQGIKLDKSKEGAPGTSSSERCALACVVGSFAMLPNSRLPMYELFDHMLLQGCSERAADAEDQSCVHYRPHILLAREPLQAGRCGALATTPPGHGSMQPCACESDVQPAVSLIVADREKYSAGALRSIFQ